MPLELWFSRTLGNVPPLSFTFITLITYQFSLYSCFVLPKLTVVFTWLHRVLLTYQHHLSWCLYINTCVCVVLIHNTSCLFDQPYRHTCCYPPLHTKCYSFMHPHKAQSTSQCNFGQKKANFIIPFLSLSFLIIALSSILGVERALALGDRP
jgi:hypothetical protein